MNYAKINFRGQEILVIEDRVRKEDRIEGLHYYSMRHSDEDWSEPCTIEYGVMVNHYGTMITKEPLIMTETDHGKTEPTWIELTEEESEAIGYPDGEYCTIEEYIAG